MDLFATIEEKWNTLCEKTRPGREKTGKALRKTGHVLQVTWDTVYRLRSVLLAIPVAVAAVWLAFWNLAKLPDSVGILLLSNGEYSMLMPKELAVLLPVAVTAVCILLMLCSKKPLYPWLISLFSLSLPLLIRLTNAYPA